MIGAYFSFRSFRAKKQTENGETSTNQRYKKKRFLKDVRNQRRVHYPFLAGSMSVGLNIERIFPKSHTGRNTKTCILQGFLPFTIVYKVVVSDYHTVYIYIYIYMRLWWETTSNINLSCVIFFWGIRLFFTAF